MQNISSLEDISNNSRAFATPGAYLVFSSSILLPDLYYNFTFLSGKFRLIDLMLYKYNQELPPKNRGSGNTAPACVGCILYQQVYRDYLRNSIWLEFHQEV